MELRLLIAHDGDDRDVVVEADPTHQVGDLADALGRHLGTERRPSLTIDGCDDPLDGDAPLGRCGLRTGDRVHLDAPPPAPPTTVLEIAVTGGPAAGTCLPLPRGVTVVGRGEARAGGLPDPFVSRSHLRVEVDDGGVRVADAGSSNGTTLGDRRLDGEGETVSPPTVLTLGASVVEVRRTQPPPARPAATDGRVAFNRPPRVRRPSPPTTWSVPAPPAAAERNRLPLASSLVPIVLAVGMWLVAGNASFLAFAALSPLMAIASVWEERRGGRQQRARAVDDFLDRLERTRAEAESGLAVLTDERRRATPDAVDLLQRATAVRRDLWERDLDDPDALLVRVGWGALPSGIEVTLEAGGDEELRSRAERRLAGLETCSTVPLPLDLRAAGNVGLAGPSEAVDALLRWIVGQVAVLQPPTEVVLAAAIHPSRAPGWDFASWLPHVGHETSPLGSHTPHLARDAVAAGDLLHAVLEVVRSRTREREAEGFGHTPPPPRPVIVLAIDGGLPLRRDDVAELLRTGPDAGVHTVWGERDRDHLPAGCRAVVDADRDDGTFEVIETTSGRVQPGGGLDGLRADLALELARALAPVWDRSARGAAGAVPRSAPLLELLGHEALQGERVRARWADRPDGLAAVIGVGAAGPLTLDLRHDGPHALLGGTTGAGKSELLQSWVVSMAVTHPPERLTFLLIDYKGGAAFKDCVHLPHTVGLVTDLDGALVHRALISLHAELKHREHVLRDAGAKDLPELERRDPSTAPPNLLIVVDEFATLTKELPEFVDGIVDVAQRGRSLGVHLVLATQRPSGAINDNIRANTNLRIALRMNDETDSEDVLGIPDAAHLSRDLPGRGFVRTGPREFTEFQGAYGGTSSSAHASATRLTVRDHVVSDGTDGEVTLIERPIEDTTTDLTRLIAAVRDAHDRSGQPAPRRPWLPELPGLVPLARLRAEVGDAPGAGRGLLGVLDVPETQSQHAWYADIEANGGLLVYGASGAGKTSTLLALAASLASERSADELHLYGLDHGARGLRPLEVLPHCGDVVAGDDRERVVRLLEHLQRTVTTRRAALGASGASDLDSHTAATGEVVPRIVLLVDEVAGLLTDLERVDHGRHIEALPRLVSEGRAVGVHLVISAERRNDLPQQVAGLVHRRLVLSLVEPDDYVLLGVDADLARGLRLPPGRAVVDGRHQLQVAWLGDVPDAASRDAALAGSARRMATPATPVPRVRLLPTQVPVDVLPPPEGPLVWFALDEHDHLPAALDLRAGHALVTGRARSGRSTTLRTVASQLARTPGAARRFLFAPRGSRGFDHAWFDEVATGVDGCDDLAHRLLDEPDLGPVVLLVDDAEELVHSSAEGALEQLARRGRTDGVTFVVAAELGAVLGTYTGLLTEIRRDRHGVLLRPDDEIDGDVLGLALPRRSTLSRPPGRGYLVREGAAMLVQVAETPGD